jgi:NTP pyrophosphatase (non-canonical NTP hydrolase)
MMNKLVEEWSKVFGLLVNDNPTIPVEHELNLGIKLINEEVDELNEAVKNKDLNEIADAAGDSLWTIFRLMQVCGLEPNDVLQKVYESNMSKTDSSIDDAKITMKQYEDMNIQVYQKNVGEYIITYRLSDNKVLKSHKFHTPNFNYNEAN